MDGATSGSNSNDESPVFSGLFVLCDYNCVYKIFIKGLPALLVLKQARQLPPVHQAGSQYV